MLKIGKYDIHALVPVLVLLGPALIAASSQVQHPSWAALLQVGGIICVGLGGHALPQPSWAVGKPLVPAAAVGVATPLVTVLYQLAQSQPAGVAQTLLYGACCGLSFAAGLHAPSALQSVPGVAQAAKALLVVCGAIVALYGAPALAQSTGCMGLAQVHCGVSASFLGLRPGLAGSPLPVELGAGPSIEYHWASWELGTAILGNAVLPLILKSQPTSEVTWAVFAGLDGLLSRANGVIEAILAGLRLGVSAVIAGPNGGLAGGFTWKQCVGVVLAGSPELLAYAQAGAPK